MIRVGGQCCRRLVMMVSRFLLLLQCLPLVSNALMEKLLGGIQKNSKNGFLGRIMPPGDMIKLRNQLLSNKDTEQRQLLKKTLLEECTSGSPSRERIEELIQQLAPLSPTRESCCDNPLLQRSWSVAYTSEKEINFFVDWGITRNLSDIFQEISDNGSVLENCIPFKNGGSLSVMGSLQADKESKVRTNFEFSKATLDLGPRWKSFEIPPVGKGWFDTVYLDQDLRVDENSRDDILICIPSQRGDEKLS